MRFQILLLLVLVTALCETNAQQWEWASNFSFPGSEGKTVIGGTDRDGNLYCAVRSDAISAQMFVLRYNMLKIDPQGKLVWSKEISEYTGAKIATDPDGNTYMVVLDQMAKIDANGAFVWQKSANGQRFFGEVYFKQGKLLVTGRENDKQMFFSEYDQDGSIISSIKGFKSGMAAIDFSDNLFIYTSDYPDPKNGNMGRLIKYSGGGLELFEKSIPQTVESIITDKNGNVYVAGIYLSEPIDIEGQKFSTPWISTVYTVSQFLIKYDGDGKLLWYKLMTHGSESIDLKIDEDNNLYYLTDYQGEFKINDQVIAGNQGLMLVKFSSDGNLFWYE
jgi:hypothetical protein